MADYNLVAWSPKKKLKQTTFSACAEKWAPKSDMMNIDHMIVKVNRVWYNSKECSELSVLLVFDCSKLYFYYCLLYLVVWLWMNADRCLTPVTEKQPFLHTALSMLPKKPLRSVLANMANNDHTYEMFTNLRRINKNGKKIYKIPATLHILIRFRVHIIIFCLRV